MVSVAFSPFKFGKQLVSNPDPFKDFFIHPLLSVVPHANLFQWSNLVNNRNNQLYEKRVSSIDIGLATSLSFGHKNRILKKEYRGEKER